MQSSYTWRVIDMSKANATELLETMWYAKDYTNCINSVLLDWIDPEMMSAMIEELDMLPSLKHLSLVGIGSEAPHFVENPTSLNWQSPMSAIYESRSRGRLRSLETVSVLGGPGFPPGFSSLIAEEVQAALENLNIKSDIVFCTQDDTALHGKRNLQEAHERKCCSCGESDGGCTPCLNKRLCKHCARYWCAKCPVSLEIVCYECGRFCKDCSTESTIQCKQCSSAFCPQHTFANEKSAAEGRKRGLCDWCIEGEKTRSRDR
ncbi:hypothetical protein BCR37DRAFT_391897 [Protomyces lactucae-debilis]|uniref:Uncharacterized protein n=1 Tax=Protomyces lactucae-debilis TaxID=2754530 RepID=A0A1Y2FL53_PROLT|nr:uncharacterized protein BCR37DRAFT_391897 [Protomyces lactucae-debilis]ORY84307.1 hypothetical protein BCR37DRAFT_391897 [Protomyces lactucae-debilis]